jgi:hypothetical protein
VPLDDAGAERKRELEEILALRRSFGTLGRRLNADKRPIQIGLANPEQVAETDSEPPEVPDSNQISTTVRRLEPVADADALRIPDPPAPSRERRLPWPWLVAVAAALAAGLVVGIAVSQPAPPRPAPPVSSQTAATAPSVTTGAEARPPASVPPSCLTTAERGDLVIDMLVKNQRGEPLGRALKAYTEASQSCRKEASTR